MERGCSFPVIESSITRAARRQHQMTDLSTGERPCLCMFQEEGATAKESCALFALLILNYPASEYNIELKMHLRALLRVLSASLSFFFIVLLPPAEAEVPGFSAAQIVSSDMHVFGRQTQLASLQNRDRIIPLEQNK